MSEGTGQIALSYCGCYSDLFAAIHTDVSELAQEIVLETIGICLAGSSPVIGIIVIFL